MGRLRILGVLSAGLGLWGCAVSTGGVAPVDYRGYDPDAAPVPTTRDNANAQPARNPLDPVPAPSTSVATAELAPLATSELAPAAPAPQRPPPQPTAAPRVERGSGVPPPIPDQVIVAPGETLFQISERYQVALRPLIEANALRAPYVLRAGEALTLPERNLYRVQSGDTLFSIARRHRIDLRSLANLNALEPPYVLRPGDEILLPALARDYEAVVRAPAPSAKPTTTTPSASAVAREARPNAIASAPANTPFQWPVRGEILSGFGPKEGGRRNDGLNIAANEGAPVRAAADGSVVYVGSELAGYGELVLVKHADDWVTAYAHNRRVLVARGDRVQAGQPIAEAGSTGSVDRPQLHFETRKGVRPVDPLGVLPPTRS
ncbi:MAG: peptidoglycan DD-metalloendopeptidase family protein [Maricaulaceae bacterium]